MTTKRTLTAAELARLFKAQVREPDFAIDLGGGIRAVQMASHDGLHFSIERGTIRNGADKYLADLSLAELAEISEILWARFAPFLPDDLDEDLTPDTLKEEPDPVDLEPDPLGLTPSLLREKKDPLAGTMEGLLTPKELRD